MNKFVNNIIAGLLSGLVIGIFFGLFEYILGTSSYSRIANHFFIIILSYGSYYMIFMGLMAVPVWLLTRKSPDGKNVLAFIYSSLALILCIFIYFLFMINSRWTGSPVSPAGLTANSIALLITIVLFYIVYKISLTITKKTIIAYFIVLFSGWAIFMVVFIGPSFLNNNKHKKDFSKRNDLPNVLILVVDALRPDHLGCYGYSRNTSPNTDIFSTTSVKFTNCKASSSWTIPTVTSIVSGLLPASHNNYFMNSTVPDDAVIIPDAMRGYGYNTAFISATPLVSNAAGFGQKVDYHAFPKVIVYKNFSLGYFLKYLDQYTARIFGIRINSRYIFKKILILFSEDNSPYKDVSWVNDKLVNWIKTLDKESFFVYGHYMEPHTPYYSRPEFDKMFLDKNYKGPLWNSMPTNKIVEGSPFPLSIPEPFPEDQRKHIINRYDVEIAYFDSHFGNLIKELKTMGVYDNTIIVLTADHGEEFYERGGWGHGHTLYQEVLDIPLIIKMPDNAHAGLVLEGVIRQVDILPTILELTGNEPWPHLQGSSWKNIIETENREYLGGTAYADVLYRGNFIGTYIESGNKVINIKTRTDDYWFLYDLMLDPEEKHSLSQINPDVLEMMKKKLNEIKNNLKEKQWDSLERSLSPEELKKFQALGYFQ